MAKYYNRYFMKERQMAKEDLERYTISVITEMRVKIGVPSPLHPLERKTDNINKGNCLEGCETPGTHTHSWWENKA